MSEVERCKSVKSRNNPFEKCERVACENGLCKSHYKYKNIIFYDPVKLNPLNSENDTDPVSLEKIYEQVGKNKKICQPYRSLFTYTMTIGDKSYQRTLQLVSLQQLLLNNILKDPFSNQPFPNDILERARKEIAKLPSARTQNRKEQQKMRMNLILDKFQSLGYYINPEWVSSKQRTFFITWLNEVNHLWIIFRNENPEAAPYIYPNGVLNDIPFHAPTPEVILNITSRLVDFMSSMMGIMIVLSALAYISEDVKRSYPDLIE